MIMNNLKADISEAAQKKLQNMITEAVEKKVRKEVKKLAFKLTVKLILTGAVVAGVCYAATHSDKLVQMLPNQKK